MLFLFIAIFIGVLGFLIFFYVNLMCFLSSRDKDGFQFYFPLIVLSHFLDSRRCSAELSPAFVNKHWGDARKTARVENLSAEDNKNKLFCENLFSLSWKPYVKTLTDYFWWVVSHKELLRTPQQAWGIWSYLAAKPILEVARSESERCASRAGRSYIGRHVPRWLFEDLKLQLWPRCI